MILITFAAEININTFVYTVSCPVAHRFPAVTGGQLLLTVNSL